MPRRNFDIDEVDNGYQISISQPQKANDNIYVDNYRAVAADKEQAMSLFVDWLKGNDQPETPKIESK